MLEVDISLNIISEKMMKMSEITASTTLLNTADKCDELVKERKKREQIRKTRERLSKQQQQLVQLQRT
jgi:hypothetical protein